MIKDKVFAIMFYQSLNMHCWTSRLSIKQRWIKEKIREAEKRLQGFIRTIRIWLIKIKDNHSVELSYEFPKSSTKYWLLKLKKTKQNKKTKKTC